MDFVNILLIGSAVFIVLLLWIVVGFRYLKNFKEEIARGWWDLNLFLRKRQDLIPNLVETFRMLGGKNEELIEKLISERIRAAKEYYPGADKIEFEYDLSASINELIAFANENPEIGKSTNFLELKGEIEELESLIEKESLKYNETVRKYNRVRKSFLLFPISAVFRFKPENIFEVEV